MNELNNGDVIKRNREYTDNQTRIFLDLLKDFLELSDINISEEKKKSIREKISKKITKINE
jgi:hypothetical protein